MKLYTVSHEKYKVNKYTLYKFGIIIFSFIYAFFLSSLPIDAFVDRDNYLIYAERADYLIGLNYQTGIFRLIFNEPVWLIINLILSFLFNPENSVRIIIFFSSFTVSYYSLKYGRKNFFLVLLILFLPQIIKNHIIHLRQGLALSFFLIGWFSDKKNQKNLFFIISAFIHSSFLFVLAFIFIDKLISKLKFDIYIKTIIYFLASISILLLMGVLASVLGARQVEETVPVLKQISGFGFIFWFAMLILYLQQKEFFIARQSFIVICIVFYLTTYFFTAYTARIFESSMLIILLSGVYFTRDLRVIFIILISIYFFGQWYPLLDLPGFGWGVENF